MLIFMSKFFDCKSDKIIVTAINVFLTNTVFFILFPYSYYFLEQHILWLTRRNVFYRLLFQFPFEKYCFFLVQIY